MTLHVHRSQRVEELVDALARELPAAWSDDPFEPVPIVVGSRGMERWLRQELATRLGALARVDFLFPGTAFEGAAQWLTAGRAAGDRAAFWEPVLGAPDGWSGPALAARVLAGVRARLGAPSFASVRRYLGDVGGAVGARELAFAGEVSATIERLLHDRPDDVLAWIASPAAAGEHAWIAELLTDLDAGAASPSPARRLDALSKLRVVPTGRALLVFGLSTLRPGDKRRLAELARHLDLHLFALTPSHEWWEDIRSHGAVAAELRTTSDPEHARALVAELDRKNAVLAANGAPSRDFQLWIEGIGYHEATVRADASALTTLLGQVQSWIGRAADNPRRDEAPWRDDAGCASLEIHACHGPLRQCEALRDELLRRFAADATLEPRHVLVMTPDVATYAPLVAAVFARRGEGVPQIPVHIADLGLRATNPVADALLQILALAEERITASRLLDLLSLGPVRARFELAEDDVADIRAMVLESRIRWAWDAADRARHDQPRLDQNTVRFGLERLALGVLMHDPGELGVVPAGADGELGPAVPAELASRERVERFGRLAEICEELERLRGRLLAPATRGEWHGRLRDVVEAFTRVDESAAGLRVQVEETLADLLADRGDELAFDRAAIALLLEGAFDRSRHGDRPATGAVTVCALEPMRSVPFRVVAMIGLDDGAFPRPGRPAAWDPFAKRRPGEDDRRTIDRHLFLEAILCARDALLLFGTGFEEKRGDRVPVSIVATELAEIVASGLGVEPDAVPIAHPLQPWSEQRFANEKTRPFDPVWADAATALRDPRAVPGVAATRLDARWPEEEHPPRTIRAAELAAALAKPQQELLRRRLGLALAVDGGEVPDREPLEHGTLEAWAVRDRVLSAIAGGAEPDLAALEARLRGEGDLPLSAAGRRALERCVEQAREAREKADQVPGARDGALEASCDVEGIVVAAVATEVRLDGGDRHLVWVTASSEPNATSQLTGWITLLVAVAAGERVRSARLVGCGKAIELRAPADADAARAHLRVLVAIWRQLRRAPVPLFPRLSREIAASDDAPADAVLAATCWEGNSRRDGDRDDPWVAALFGHLSIDDLAERAGDVVRVARDVWRPLLDARANGKKGRGAPRGAAGEDA